MALSLIAGHYTATYAPGGSASASIGTTREGFKIRETNHVQQIQTDEYGEAPADGIGQGLEVTVTLDYVEYSLIKPALNASNPEGDMKTAVGYIQSARAGALVLTPQAGTPAAAGGAYTFPKAIVQSDVETLLASKLRQGPITFKCYPDQSTGLCYTRA